MRLQLVARAIAARTTCGCSLWHVRLQPAPHAVAACGTCGCSLRRTRLQLVARAVAACVAHGCSLWHVRLQPASHTASGASPACRCFAPSRIPRPSARCNSARPPPPPPPAAAAASRGSLQPQTTVPCACSPRTTCGARRGWRRTMTSHGESSGCSAGSRPLCVPTPTTHHPTPNTQHPTPNTQPQAGVSAGSRRRPRAAAPRSSLAGGTSDSCGTPCSCSSLAPPGGEANAVKYLLC
jgi:hypothetical protein